MSPSESEFVLFPLHMSMAEVLFPTPVAVSAENLASSARYIVDSKSHRSGLLRNEALPIQ
jgi:hypothetical protein